IGGMATLIGTPPNLIFAGAAEQLTGQRVGFVEFMAFGLPVAAILLPLTWALLVFVLFRARVESGDAVRELFAERRRALGRLGGGERRVLVVFGLTALAWLLREPKVFGALTVPGLATFFPGITDATIAIGGAVLLFVVPGREPTGVRRPLLTWPEARHI